MEAIFSAAESGFNGSLVEIFVLTNPAAYMGTITGCFLLPVKSTNKLTMFRVSIPKEHKSCLLLWEPPHWYLKPCASWISCSSVHTSSKASLVFIGKVLVSSKCFREVTSSSASGTSMEGKHASKIRSRRFNKAVCIKTPPKSLFSFNFDIIVIALKCKHMHTLSTTVRTITQIQKTLSEKNTTTHKTITLND
uniref:Uncharacterized protein n=1 Tax=Theropithecus gelada TaxID=9565 RepID=A0A8D2EY51_THEGE